MSDTNILRTAGISGIAFLVLFIPSFLTAPDSPVATSTQQELTAYFSARRGEILFQNGLLLVFAAFFFLWFSAFCTMCCKTPRVADMASRRSR